MNKFLSLALIIVSLVTGLGIGYILSPQYSNSINNTIMITDLGKSDKEVDLRFLDAMIAHHNSAIVMANVATSQSQRSEIRTLADSIISTQSKEVIQMKQWKKDWFGNKDSGFSMNDMMTNLGTYDDKFDLRFINAMSAHHKEAISMAQEIETKSTRNEILNFASNIILMQEKEVKQMQSWRMSFYQIVPEQMNTSNSMYQ